MKKHILTAILLFSPLVVKADSLIDQFYAGFVGNAKLAIESNTDGKTRPMFLDNFFEIGNIKGEHIAAIDSGVLGTILPETGKLEAAEWTTGAKIHLAPVLKNYVTLPEQWKFLNTLEIDLRASFNWTQRHPFYGLVAAYPFK